MRTGPDSPPPPPDPARLAQDWITLWQSEFSALAADRELQETMQRLASFWAAMAQVTLPAMMRAAAGDGPAGRTPAAAPAGAAAAAAAPDAVRHESAELERLNRRVAELEQRLERIERGS